MSNYIHPRQFQFIYGWLQHKPTEDQTWGKPQQFVSSDAKLMKASANMPSMPITATYRVCHGFRFNTRDDYFCVHFDYF